MNYIYDILLNFHKEDYDFFDWNVDDNIIHIRKTPIFRVSTDMLYKIIHYNVNVSLEFLNKISNRTEMFTNKNVKVIKSVCLFTDCKDAVAINFFNNGKKEKISRFLLDEKEEILEMSENIEESSIDFIVHNEIKRTPFRTRNEQKIYQFIQKELQTKNYEKLKYTYFECFNIIEEDYDNIVNKLKTELDSNWEQYYNQIYNILKLSTVKKSKNY